MKLGIFGGSFDPIHMGHLVLADCAREAAGLDQVLFVPAAKSPLKPGGPYVKNRPRTEMLQLAIGGNDAFAMSKMELDRKGTSFTIDTLNELREERPDDEFFLIVGSDSLADFAKWKDIEKICEMAIPLVAARRGDSADLDQLKPFVSETRLNEIKKFAFQFPWIEISSTEIRERLADGRSVRYRMPRSVECYIDNAKLYREAEAKK